MNGTSMEGVSSFKYLGSCFSKAGGPQEGVKISMTMMFHVRSVSMGVKRELMMFDVRIVSIRGS